jgi:hypothetical protein
MKKNTKTLIELAGTMTAKEFTNYLDLKRINWMWEDCDNIGDYNEGRCTIHVDSVDTGFWFENGEFVESYELCF